MKSSSGLLDIKPISGAVGAEIHGVDLKDNIPEEQFSDAPKFVTKRNRLVPLQKRTLYKLEQYYDEHSEILESDYRIRSFSDFVNYCILKYLPTLDKQLKNPTILYEDI